VKKVFIGGSRGVSRLNDKLRERLDNIVNNDFSILVGDANGADRAVQDYLNGRSYKNVTVYCSGNNCRNNTGNWSIKNVEVPQGLKGRDFYMVKDKKMSEECDYAFMLWDGKSSGTINNILNMLSENKSSLVYYSKEKEFHKIIDVESFTELLNKCEEKYILEIDKKIKINSRIKEIKTPVSEQLQF
jgi:hypothetical protein